MSPAHEIVTLAMHGQPVPLALAQRARDEAEALVEALAIVTGALIKAWALPSEPVSLAPLAEARAILLGVRDEAQP